LLVGGFEEFDFVTDWEVVGLRIEDVLLDSVDGVVASWVR